MTAMTLLGFMGCANAGAATNAFFATLLIGLDCWEDLDGSTNLPGYQCTASGIFARRINPKSGS
jgi:hypothetical protein